MSEKQVLDRGFVRLEDAMGGDLAVVRAARVSYKPAVQEPPDELRDRKLIAYLLAHEHGTPFEHAVLKFHVKAPIFVARQWFRHRTSSYNEASYRYQEPKEEFYFPATWRQQDQKNKQGSTIAHLDDALCDSELQRACASGMEAYKNLIARGVARELARLALPVNLYTEWYWTVNARALMHFLRLRCEAHAQWEIRQYAFALYQFFRGAMPWTADAFVRLLPYEQYPEICNAIKETQ